MKLFILVVILSLIALFSLAIVVALYRHKKESAATINLIGAFGEVTMDLSPEGAVLVHGDLWPARSGNGRPMPAGSRVRVIEIVGHLLLVEVCE